MKRLQLAIDALKTDDRNEALRHLLRRWRHVHDPDLADAIQTVAPEAVPFDTEHALERCLGALERPRDGVLSRVLATVPLLPAAQASQVLDGLREWPDDPRIVGHLLTWFSDPPWRGTHGQRAWRRVFRLLEQRADPRQDQVLDYDPGGFFHGPMRGWMADQLDRLADRPQPVGARLPPHEHELLTHVITSAQPPADPLEAYWGAVWKRPDDLGARMVLSDALTERGDARGSFIALQVQNTPRARSRAELLLQQHGHEWLGPLDDALLSRGRRFVNGFLDAGIVKPKNPAAAEAAMGHPAWSTVTELEMRSSLTRPGVFELATQQAASGLRTLRGLLTAEQLVEVLRNPHGKSLSALGLGSDKWVQTWSVPRGRPAMRLDLRHLEIASGALDLRSWLSRTLGRLPSVTLTTADVPTSGLLHLHPTDALAAMDALMPLARDRLGLVIAPGNPVLIAHREREEDWLLDLTLLRMPGRPTGHHAINAMLASLDAKRVKRVTVPERLLTQLPGLQGLPLNPCR